MSKYVLSTDNERRAAQGKAILDQFYTSDRSTAAVDAICQIGHFLASEGWSLQQIRDTLFAATVSATSHLETEWDGNE